MIIINKFGGNLMTTNNRNVKSSKYETIKCTSSLQNKKICAEKTRIKAIAVDKKSCEKTLEYYCVEWLAVTKNRIKDSTYVKYFNIVNNHILPALGSLLPEEIDELKIMNFENRLLESGSKQGRPLSPKTVKDILLVLNSIIKFIRHFHRRDLPQVDISYPKRAKKDIRVLSVEEQERLIKYLTFNTDSCKFGIMLAMYTGLRIGEICALKWGDISTDNGTVHICRTMQRLQKTDSDKNPNKTEIKISSPKSDSSDRWIPMTENLRKMCISMQAESPDAYVLTGCCTQFMEPRSLQYRFSKYTGDCGINGITFHTLRHTFATRCVEVGFEIKSLSEILGHSDVKITLNKYVHSSEKLKKENMDKLSAIGF